MTSTHKAILLAGVASLVLTCFLTSNRHEIEEPYIEHHDNTFVMETGNGPVFLGQERSRDWPKVRKAYLSKHPSCEYCGVKYSLNVHHILPYHLWPKLELVESNLITLCRDCHFRHGHSCGNGKSDWARCYNPNIRAEISKRKKNAVR